ncbi:hypothetical protein [Hyphomicrobium facile]|uniref:Uncharacterized protein n=1 Tax=Hyphomicrobium facile TaxID=51670 RepID=A0A1I7MTM7_9HYPH|nr:hypothetical protein [Hyphomicrobium facile]SFV25751.1 hypothetical protein SAMN04488557_0090 [Hyphomicrobium facile]
MSYEDPRSGRERNLGQDDVANSTGSWIAGIIVVAAIALGGWYYYNHTQRVADVNHPATNAATDTTKSSAPADTSSSSTGASTGTSGTSPNTETGVKTPAPTAPKP